MGMFDDITDVPPLNCRKCGAPVSNWQSKDGDCQLEKIPYWEVRDFYSMCSNEKCREWHQYHLKEPAIPRPFSDYELLPPAECFKADGEGQHGQRRGEAVKMCPECKAVGGPDGVTNCETCRGEFWLRDAGSQPDEVGIRRSGPTEIGENGCTRMARLGDLYAGVAYPLTLDGPNGEQTLEWSLRSQAWCDAHRRSQSDRGAE
jgi:hypothetical protein